MIMQKEKVNRVLYEVYYVKDTILHWQNWEMLMNQLVRC